MASVFSFKPTNTYLSPNIPLSLYLVGLIPDSCTCQIVLGQYIKPEALEREFGCTIYKVVKRKTENATRKCMHG